MAVGRTGEGRSRGTRTRADIAVYFGALVVAAGVAVAIGSPILYGLTPAAAALVAVAVRTPGGLPSLRAAAARLAFRWPRDAWNAFSVAVLVPTAIMVAGTVVAVAAGAASLAGDGLGGTLTRIVEWGLLAAVGGVAALGEEAGWRGWLLPLVIPAGRLRAGVAMGLVWAVWHLPLMLRLGVDQAPLTPAGLTLFALELIGLTIFLNELRLRDGLLPAAAAHGAHNAAWAVTSAAVVAPTAAYPLIGPQAGIVPTALYLGVAAAILVRARSAAPAPAVAAATCATSR